MSASPSDRVFVDTNVWTYLFDRSEPRKQKAARSRLDQERASAEVVVSTQVLQELYVSLTRGKNPIATADAAAHAVQETSTFTVIQISSSMVLDAISESRRHQLSLWDALIIRAAVAGGCSRMLSEDLNHGQVIDGVRIENPFA